jgi:deoxyribonuclease-4
MSGKSVIRFGPAGNSDAFYGEGHKHTYEAPKWLSGLGLSAMEYSFGRGVRLKEAAAIKIKEQADMYGIQMSVHAPYYINLANDAYENNLRYFNESSAAAINLGAERVVFHPGSQGAGERAKAYGAVKENLSRIVSDMKREGFTGLKYCAETMGKLNQIGDVEEIAGLCLIDDMVYPTVDFGHLNARTCGALKGEDDYAEVLDLLKNSIGFEKYKNMHIHFSHIEYTEKGEKRHLTLEDTE